MAERSTGIILIIALIIIAGGAWYFLNGTPATPGANTAATFDQQNQTVITSLRATPGEPIAFSSVFEMDAGQLQALRVAAQAQTNNDSVKAFNQIVQLTADAAIKQFEFQSLATQIQNIPVDGYCDNITLFTQRDQKGTEMIQLLAQAKQAISVFVADYPTIAAQYQITTDSYDYSNAQAAQESRIEVTRELQQNCEGIINE